MRPGPVKKAGSSSTWSIRDGCMKKQLIRGFPPTIPPNGFFVFYRRYLPKTQLNTLKSPVFLVHPMPPSITNILHAHCLLYCIVCRDNSQYYSPVLNNPATSQVFINNILGIIDKYNLDGVDLDWEVNTNKENLL